MQTNVNPEFSRSGASAPGSIQRLSDGAGVNYVNPNLVAVNSLNAAGVIATSPIRSGEILVVYGGVVVDREHTEPLDIECRSYFYQVAPGIWYGPGSSLSSLGIGERLNHSCEPNAGFSSPVTLVALRDIQAGESVTLDYANFQSDELEGSSFACECGSARCRGVVSSDDWRGGSSAAQSYPSMQPFIQSLIDPDGSEDAKLFSSLILPTHWQTPWRGGALSATLVSTSVTRSLADGSIRAARPIEADEVVFIGGGVVFRGGHDRRIDPELRQYYRALSDGFIIGPRDQGDVGFLESLAIALEPNLERILDIFFIATRRIATGEILTRQQPC
jgi:hypothetical protein